MKRNLFSLVFLLISCVSVFSQAPGNAEQEVLKIEGDRVAAVLGQDLAKLEQILADDLTYVHSNARIESKTEFIGSLKSGSIKYEAIKHKDAKANLYGNTAVLRGLTEVTVRASSQQVNFQARFMAVYVKRDG